VSRREPSLLETLKEAGLSERIRVAFPLAERPQIHQEGDRFVVFTRLPGTDQITGQFPGGIFSLCELASKYRSIMNRRSPRKSPQ
jgi:hypothetical protein